MNNLIVYDKSAIFIGYLHQNSTHKHHALQLIISLDGDLDVVIDNRHFKTNGIIINQNITHQINSKNQKVFIVLLEPLLLGKNIIQNSENPYNIINEESLGRIREYITEKKWNNIIEEITINKEIKEIDQRVQNIINHITKEEDCKHNLDDFSKTLKISKSRISHLFNKEIGVSLKYYILWMKTLFAIDSLRSCNDLTTIALDCGFSDLSHLSRTFKKMFGHTPSEIFKNSISVQVEFKS